MTFDHIVDIVGTNAHGYGNCAPLSVLSVMNDTWVTKLTYPESCVCAWTTSTTLIACY